MPAPVGGIRLQSGERKKEWKRGQGRGQRLGQGKGRGQTQGQGRGHGLRRKKKTISLYANCLIPILMSSQYPILSILHMKLELTFHHILI